MPTSPPHPSRRLSPRSTARFAATPTTESWPASSSALGQVARVAFWSIPLGADRLQLRRKIRSTTELLGGAVARFKHSLGCGGDQFLEPALVNLVRVRYSDGFHLKIPAGDDHVIQDEFSLLVFVFCLI